VPTRIIGVSSRPLWPGRGRSAALQGNAGPLALAGRDAEQDVRLWLKPNRPSPVTEKRWRTCGGTRRTDGLLLRTALPDSATISAIRMRLLRCTGPHVRTGSQGHWTTTCAIAMPDRPAGSRMCQSATTSAMASATTWTPCWRNTSGPDRPSVRSATATQGCRKLTIARTKEQLSTPPEDRLTNEEWESLFAWLDEVKPRS
jgi:hypothetical protein